MARRYFNAGLAQSPETKAHMTVMEGAKPVHLPIVNGVVSIPDNLAPKVTMGPAWVPYTGQVPVGDGDLQPVESVDAIYGAAKKK
ncbi:hypothetical protein [Alicyclobacillus sp. ALC3]|uniref:hypothetical protein n=1 Tax=Alicyclobacillus sp. ALC3 TaxID=2796143 RepID=UPI0023796E8E|nr:hypothetical protein [Alicyclobacillus sp. ALC3]WDL97805.1 hypothetical protein JC200_03480 [Alicyclobacillus sp. ALC3]